MSSPEDEDAAFKKAIKGLEGEKRAAVKKAKATKGKKAKDVIVAVEEEYASKLKELQARHEQQLARIVEGWDKPTQARVEDTSQGGKVQDSAKDRKQDKARRKKERQREREMQRQKEIEEEAANAGPSLRSVELEQIRNVLTPLNLLIAEVEADGHCLYRAVGGHTGRDYMNVRKSIIHKSYCSSVFAFWKI
jgi:OTU domain-containing protein 6